MWYTDSLLYQIYPLGFCGAPAQNTGEAASRIGRVAEWIPHIKALGADTLLFGPLFESDAHGYDTRDYKRIDRRLGSNEDFAALCKKLHAEGLRVVLDGVFNHVGRGFWAFEDVRKNREASPYTGWFHLDFGRDSNYGDGFWYEGWEGHFELVKLNLHSEEVVNYLFGCIEEWVTLYGIDGLRLDVAYMLDDAFLRRLHDFCKGLREDFFLVGEAIHGDYSRLVAPGVLDSATNYECYKGIWSSLNDENLFEIAHSLNRQFGPEHWTLYKGLPLLSFVDNHDVSRIASALKNPAHIRAAYGLLLGMPGVPCIYYGSEWGATGSKQEGDAALRRAYEQPVENETSAFVAALAKQRAGSAALRRGGYRQLYLTNRQFIFMREHEGEAAVVGINLEPVPHEAGLPLTGRLTPLDGGAPLPCEGKLTLAPGAVAFWGFENRL